MKKLIAFAVSVMMAFSAFGATTTYEDTTIVGTEYCAAGVIYTDDTTRTYEVTSDVVDGLTVETRIEISNVPTTTVVRDSAISDHQTITDLANTSQDNGDGTRSIFHTWNTNVWQEYTELGCSGDVVPGSLATSTVAFTEVVATTGELVTIETTIDFVGDVLSREFIGEEVRTICGAWVPTEQVPTIEFDPTNPTYTTEYSRECTEETVYVYQITIS